MQLSRAFSYQTEDVQWPTKLGLAALMSLVPILNFAVVGYEVDIVRNVAAGMREPLPQWDNLGKKWREGLILTVAGLVYAIPVLIGIGVVLAVLVASGAISRGGSTRPVGALGVMTLVCFLVFLLIYSLLLSLLRPVILVLFSREGTLESCFRFSEIARVINRQPGLFLTTWAVITLAGLAVGLIVAFINAVIGWIPCIGWIAGILLGFATTTYLLTVDGYIYGQFRLAAFEAEKR